MRRESDLRYYQEWMERMIRENPYLLLAVPMGLGKTAATLTAVKKLLARSDVYQVLIIAPLRVAKDTWPDEILAWEHTCDIPFTVIRAEDDDVEVRAAYASAYRQYREILKLPSREAAGEARKVMPARKADIRGRLTESDAPIHIINREAIPWLVKFWGKDWPYDMVVYDEASRLKGGNMRTAGGKAEAGKKGSSPLSEFGSLVRVRHAMKRVVELSGTPSPNGEIDLWGPMFLLDRGERLGRSKTAFLNRWFDQNRYTYEIKARPGAVEDITRRIKDLMFSLDAEEHLPDLPPIIPNIIKVDIGRENMLNYRQFERDLVSEAYDVEAVNSGVLTNKLLQFANGSMYRQREGERRREVVHIHDAKLDALESIIAEEGNNPILVAYSFKFDLDRIKKRFKHAVVAEDDPNFVKNWNSGKIKLALAHPASLGHGLNLQYGGHIVVWFGLTWSLELYLQFNKRLPRPGQPNPFVTIHHIIATGTNDERTLAALNRKGARQDDITRATKAHLNDLERGIKRSDNDNKDIAHLVWQLVG